jgi:hypothetical protein|tara:strand:+ start:6040 stop:6999 length:960 start_codon:yes stop_codon:yes gene_type:complete
MSSKILALPNSDYTVKVQSGGNITLDTGVANGLVTVTGNLVVLGSQTQVSSTDLNLKDNLITLNIGESGAGITLNKSGLQMDRGSLPDALFTFDETVTWADPISATTITGGFTLTNASGTLQGLRINSISTGGGDLYLINSGTGVISVTGTNNYETQITDDDDIPNKKYVDDTIITQLTSTFQRRIEEGSASKSFVEVRDTEVSGAPSVVSFQIDNVTKGQVFGNRVELEDIRIQNGTISTTSSDTDLTLESQGTGGVVVKDNFTLTLQGSDPASPTDGLKVYVKAPAAGGTGLFFKHSASKSGEIISRQNALLLSMLF